MRGAGTSSAHSPSHSSSLRLVLMPGTCKQCLPTCGRLSERGWEIATLCAFVVLNWLELVRVRLVTDQIECIIRGSTYVPSQKVRLDLPRKAKSVFNHLLRGWQWIPIGLHVHPLITSLFEFNTRHVARWHEAVSQAHSALARKRVTTRTRG